MPDSAITESIDPLFLHFSGVFMLLFRGITPLKPNIRNSSRSNTTRCFFNQYISLKYGL